MSKYVCLQHQEQHLSDYSIVPLRYEDRFSIMRWRNEQIYHLRQAHPLTETDQQRYFDNVVSKLYDNPKPDQILFSYLKNGICIGYGGLVHINWIDRNGEISFIMDTQLESEHFAEHWSNYLTMLKAVAFDDLGVLHSLWNDRYEVINYVDCTKEQSRDILALRNREDVRTWMVNPEVISNDHHFKFIESLKGNPNRLYYAIYKNGVLVGTYNLTNEGDGAWERGIIASPSTQGTGQTEKWERQILSCLPSEIKNISAKVKQDNLRSIKYHEKLGYKEQRRNNGYIYYILRLQ